MPPCKWQQQAGGHVRRVRGAARAPAQGGGGISQDRACQQGACGSDQVAKREQRLDCFSLPWTYRPPRTCPCFRLHLQAHTAGSPLPLLHMSPCRTPHTPRM
eukprot:359263-Chlamydomonas_euryale.AAC.2